MENEEIKNVLKKIISLLYSQDYNKLIELDYGKRLTAEEIKEGIEEYVGNLTLAPSEAFDKFNIYETNDKDIVNVEFDLWVNNKKSDLTLSVNIKNVGDKHIYAIQDLHVL